MPKEKCEGYGPLHNDVNPEKRSMFPTRAEQIRTQSNWAHLGVSGFYFKGEKSSSPERRESI